MEKITLPLNALKDFLGLEALISLSRENIEQVITHCKDKISMTARETLLYLIEENHETILAAKTDLLQLRHLSVAITLYAADSFAKTPADFSVGEPPRCYGVLERPIGHYTHYMCQTVPNSPFARRLPMDFTFDTGRAFLSGYGIPVVALAFMSCDALEEAMRDPLPFSQAEYEAADEEATIHNLWRLKEDRRFASTIITEGGVKNE